jgi:SAM-dependent methyltransferase
MGWKPARALNVLLNSALKGLRGERQETRNRELNLRTPSMPNIDGELSAPLTEIAGVPLPPPSVVFMRQTLEEATKLGIVMVNLLEASGVNVRDGLIFDIGCGYGRFAYGLLQTGFQGRYIGMDIVEHRVRWLQENFTPRQSRYSFHFVNVRNEHYNSTGSQKETSYQEILEGAHPDTIVLFSVFTHMYLDDIEAHLIRIAEVMSPQTKLFFTCFLFDGIAAEGIRDGTARWLFGYELSPDCRYNRPDEPLKAIAFREAAIVRAMEKAGLSGVVRRGHWSGSAQANPDYHQDWVVATKSEH